MAIGLLRVEGSGIREFDALPLTEPLEVVADELRAIISHNLLWETEMTNVVFSDEAFDFTVAHLGEGFNFDPFREVISEDQHEDAMAQSSWHLADDVHSPLHEGLRGQGGVQLLGW